MNRLFTGLWKHADFRKLWAGQTISLLGSQITALALPVAATLSLHATAFQMGLLTVSAALPTLLFGLVVGVGVDRFRRRPLLIGADLGRAVLLGTIPLAALFGLLSMGQLYLVTFLAGSLTLLFTMGLCKDSSKNGPFRWGTCEVTLPPPLILRECEGSWQEAQGIGEER